jgi:hypothetical protein
MTESQDLGDLTLRATYAARLTTLNSFEAENSCIETTRLLIGILAELGITRVRPQAVNVRVLNRMAFDCIQQGIPFEHWPKAAHTIGTDAPEEIEAEHSTGWFGHLVAIMRGEEGGRHLIDASADQFDRPGILNVPGPVGVVLGDLWTPMDPQYRVLQDEFTIIEYRPLIGPRGTMWKTFPAWQKDPEWFAEMAKTIAQEIRDGWQFVSERVA